MNSSKFQYWLLVLGRTQSIPVSAEWLCTNPLNWIFLIDFNRKVDTKQKFVAVVLVVTRYQRPLHNVRPNYLFTFYIAAQMDRRCPYQILMGIRMTTEIRLRQRVWSPRLCFWVSTRCIIMSRTLVRWMTHSDGHSCNIWWRLGGTVSYLASFKNLPIGSWWWLT